MTFIDICAGIGGFRSGLEQVGMKCVGYVEVDKFARASYEEMYDTNGEWTEWDITKVRATDIPFADMWCFGFPCQDISVAGNQKGLAGRRSGIFYDIVGLLEGKSTEDRPEWLLVENVKNLLHIDKGEGFTEVLVALDKAGYDCQWILLNSKDFGVPQNRERVFIVGHLRARGSKQVLLEPRAGGETDREVEESGLKCLRDSRDQRHRLYSVDGTSRTLTAADGGGISNGLRTGLYAIPSSEDTESKDDTNRERGTKCIQYTKREGDRIYSTDGTSISILAEGGGKAGHTGLYAVPKEEKEVKQIIPGAQANRVYDSDGLSVTIKAEGGGVGAKTGLYAVPKNKEKDTSKDTGIEKIFEGTHETDNIVSPNGNSKSLKATDYKNPHKVALPKNELKTLIQSESVQNRVYDSEGIGCTLMARDYKDPQKVAIPKEKGSEISPAVIGKSLSDYVQRADGVARTLMARDYKDPQKISVPAENNGSEINPAVIGQHQSGNVQHADGLSRTLYAVDYKEPQKVAIPCLTPDRMEKRQNGRRFKDDGDPMFTLTAQDRHGVMVHDGKEYHIRRLTPRECFRLQGFTDEQFEKAQAVNSDTQLYKQAGNAVTVNVARWMGERIMEAMYDTQANE